MAEAQVNVAGTNQARVRGPQFGQRLADITKGLLHGTRSDTERAFGESAVPVALGEDLEEGDRIGDVVQERGDAEFQAVMFPNRPSPILCVGALRNDRGSTRVFSKAEVRAEFISGRR